MNEQVVMLLIGAGVSLAGKIVFDWLKGRAPKSEPDAKDIREILELCKWLKELHDKFDDDGVPRWYIPKAIARLSQENHETIKVMVEYLRDIKGALQNGRSDTR